MSHTPTPWYQGKHVPNSVFGPDGYKVADCDMSVKKTAENLANVSLIVRAVNAHDKLVAAVKCVHDEIGSDPCSPLSERALTLIDEALAAAEGKP